MLLGLFIALLFWVLIMEFISIFVRGWILSDKLQNNEIVEDLLNEATGTSSDMIHSKNGYISKHWICLWAPYNIVIQNGNNYKSFGRLPVWSKYGSRITKMIKEQSIS